MNFKEIKGTETSFRLYDHVFITKGVSRSIIIDTDNQCFYFIPNDLSNLLKDDNSIKFSEIRKGYDIEDQNIIESYLEFLVEKKLGFIYESDLSNGFSKRDLEYKNSSIITTCTIVYSNFIKKHLDLIIKMLHAAGCRNIQFRFQNNVKYDELKFILNALKNSINDSVEFVFEKYSESIIELVKDLHKESFRLQKVLIYDSNKNETIIHDFYTRLIISTIQGQGSLLALENSEVSPKNFFPTYNLIIESLEHNVYYNRKLIIESDGVLKNYASQNNEIGNILDYNLASIENHASFVELSKITKNNISICEDCEFRNICFDSRIPKRNNTGNYYYKTKCNYNPYSNKWD